MTEQQKIILQAFQYSYGNYDDKGKLKEVLEALEKANRGEYLPHTIKTILIEIGFLNKKPQKITKSGLKYLNEISQTKEEQLRVYSAYLPYRLHVQSQTGTIYQLNTFSNIRGQGIENRDIESVLNGYFKPLLWDLSYLTKEIEHDGERFIPIVELLKIKYPNQQGRYSETEYSIFGHAFACFSVDAGKSIQINTSDLENQPFWIIQKLTSWKLNVFNLPEDQFINKATLKP